LGFSSLMLGGGFFFIVGEVWGMKRFF